MYQQASICAQCVWRIKHQLQATQVIYSIPERYTREFVILILDKEPFVKNVESVFYRSWVH
jgi:hypothetical protein